MHPAVPARRRVEAPSLLCLLVIAAAVGGCVDNPGVDPTFGELNFPIALETSPPVEGEGPQHLYVASSNFDLRFNAGAVHAYDLEALEACSGCRVTDGCVSVPARVEPQMAGGPVEQRACSGLLTQEVYVDSFTSDLERGPDGERLYVTVRSRANLTYIDLDGGRMSCGGAADAPHRCDDRFRRGDEAVANDRNIELPSDPTGVHVGRVADFAAGEDCGEGDFVLVSHRGGRVSLFLEEATTTGGVPALVDVRSGYPTDLVGIEVDPLSKLAWLPSTTELQVGRAGVALDCGTPARSLLFNGGGLGLVGLDTGGTGRGDTRAIRFDPRATRETDPVRRAYVLSRRPEALLFVDLDQTRPGRLALEDEVDVCIGPSRLEVAEITDDDGRSHYLGFVSCFDSRDLYIIELDRRRLLGVVREMSGPFELAIDDARGRVYVADFRTSVIRVLDLAPLKTCLGNGTMRPALCSPRLRWQIGLQRPVRELR